MKLRAALPAFVFLAALPLTAQFGQRGQGKPGNQNKQQKPCWQVAGIPKGAFGQARSVRQQANSEIQSVCSNSSLTPQQKAVQVREIRQREHQQLEGIITPAQRSSLESCRAQRGLSNPTPAPHPGNAGPCGEMPGARTMPGKSTGNREEPEEEPEK